ncbi:DNA mismatch repair endonuclease MutL [Faucicola mancuniensis]|uniref:DNA mismatch repair endonuclease MutL n=1 Tax=Faucicola mancuniensis TaxID=1309795 RepID=UPI0028EB5169|nr:DNA mismatch repair endonuclease MutL [uncultured Moraxella sp.]
MSNRIHKLSPLLINQIAAGEVVTRPSSVVKELIENAIDAHATHIRIDIEQGGLGLIQITDNGNGIHPDDMILAVTRHATSKLADVGQLTGIDTLGFRGEALASICAVSHLTLATSHDTSGIGRQLTLSGDDASHADIQPIVKTKGTTVSVRDLYFNVPARRNHLKSIQTEFSHIEQIVQKIAISFADIHLELYHQNKCRLNLPCQKNDNLHRLETALNQNLNQHYEFFLSFSSLLNQNMANTIEPKVSGFLFTPNEQQNQHLPKLIYINQRLVTDLAISQTLQKVARQAGFEQLGYALFFQLPIEWINVNIHPSKQNVKIQQLANILSYLNQALLEKLKTINQPILTNKTENLVKNNLKVSEKIVDYQVNNTENYQTNIHQIDKKNTNVIQHFTQNFEKNHENFVKNTINLPLILSIIDNNSQKTLAIHYNESLFLLNISQQSLLNGILLKAENPLQAMNDWVKSAFVQNGNIEQKLINDWLKSAKQIHYADLIL